MYNTANLDWVGRQLADLAENQRIPKGTAQRVLVLASLWCGEPISGEQLARNLGLSRAAVNKHVAALREVGFNISARPGVGYVLRALPTGLPPELVTFSILAKQEIGARGAPNVMGLPYYYYERVVSTNDVARALAEGGAPHGTVVLAEQQTGGKGRLGRRWWSEPGKDLTFSLLLRPSIEPRHSGLLVLAVAAGVAEALSTDLGLGARVSLKWPNDVLVDRRKVCGILMEAAIDMDRIQWCVAGIGLNVNSHPDRLVPEVERIPGREPPVSLADALGVEESREDVLSSVLNRLRLVLSELEHNVEGCLQRIRILDGLCGRTVEVRTAEGGLLVARGLAAGIDEDGLLILDVGGAIRCVAAGEVTVVSWQEKPKHRLGSVEL